MSDRVNEAIQKQIMRNSLESQRMNQEQNLKILRDKQSREETQRILDENKKLLGQKR